MTLGEMSHLNILLLTLAHPSFSQEQRKREVHSVSDGNHHRNVHVSFTFKSVFSFVCLKYSLQREKENTDIDK